MRFSSILPLNAAFGALVVVAIGCADTSTQPPTGSLGEPPTHPPPLTPPPSPQGDGNYVYIANADGSDITLLGRGYGPLWSPDSRRIAFTSYRDGDAEIFVVDLDGGGERQITHNTVHDSDARWSPQGDRIAFGRSDGNGKWRLYVMEADGANPTALTSATMNVDFVSFGYPTSVWSPDGRRLTFNFHTSASARGGIAVINADGTGQTALTSESMGACCPTWSPDGLRIAFAAYGAHAGTWVMNADGSGLTKLTPNGAAFDFEPSWSPDGRKIAVARDVTGQSWWDEGGTVWVMNADGTGETELRRAHVRWGAVRWFPNSRDLLYVGPEGVEAVSLDTGVPTKLVPARGEAHPSPDGKRILFETISPP